MGLTITGPSTFDPDVFSDLTVSGDVSTVYTIVVLPGEFSYLEYNGNAYGASLTLTGTPSQLQTDLQGMILGNAEDGPTAVQGFSIQDSVGDLLYSVSSPICYLTGTRILTTAGERAIDDVRLGDVVPTYDGGYVAVRWVGLQRLLARFSPPGRIQPVRIRAGALGNGTPARDLYVSPGHSMLINHRFVHAALLIGCDGITQESRLDVVNYLHIDLGAHHAVLAEGAWSETYAEQWNRRAFVNAASWTGKPRFVPLSYPQVLEGDPLLQRIRSQLTRDIQRTA